MPQLVDRGQIFGMAASLQNVAAGRDQLVEVADSVFLYVHSPGFTGVRWLQKGQTDRDGRSEPYNIVR